MNGFVVTSIDRATLPTALLPIAKQHLRVDFTTDDDYIRDVCLAGAVGFLEQKFGSFIFKRDGDWSLTIEGSASAYECPVLPVVSFKVMDGAADISADYALQQPASRTDPAWLAHSDGTAFPSTAAVTLVGGYTDKDQLPPDVTSLILQVAARLYEYRETVDLQAVDLVPLMIDDLLVGNWVPRC